MPQWPVPRAEAGGGLDRAQHELPPQPDRVFERLTVARDRLLLGVA
jgi:hypothetical protein